MTQRYRFLVTVLACLITSLCVANTKVNRQVKSPVPSFTFAILGQAPKFDTGPMLLSRNGNVFYGDRLYQRNSIQRITVNYRGGSGFVDHCYLDSNENLLGFTGVTYTVTSIIPFGDSSINDPVQMYATFRWINGFAQRLSEGKNPYNVPAALPSDKGRAYDKHKYRYIPNIDAIAPLDSFRAGKIFAVGKVQSAINTLGDMVFWQDGGLAGIHLLKASNPLGLSKNVYSLPELDAYNGFVGDFPQILRGASYQAGYFRNKSAKYYDPLWRTFYWFNPDYTSLNASEQVFVAGGLYFDMRETYTPIRGEMGARFQNARRWCDRHRVVLPDSLFGKHVEIAKDFSVAINNRGQIAFVANGQVVVGTPTGGKENLNPRFLAMEDEVDGLNTLADSLEKDDQAYADAVGDILLRGYDSAFARLGLDVAEDAIPSLFMTDASAQSQRAAIVKAIRGKARVREGIAEAGITGNLGGVIYYDRVGEAGKRGGFDQNDIDYFSTLDPTKIDYSVWEALYHAGYIDHKLYKSTLYKMYAKDALEVLSWVDPQAVLERIGTSIAFRIVVKDVEEQAGKQLILREGEALTTEQLTKHEALTETAEVLSTELTTARQTADKANQAYKERFFSKPENAGRTWDQVWANGQDVRTMVVDKSFPVYRVYNAPNALGKQEIYTTTENLVGKTPEEIAQLLSLGDRIPIKIVKLETKTGSLYDFGRTTGGGQQLVFRKTEDLIEGKSADLVGEWWKVIE